MTRPGIPAILAAAFAVCAGVCALSSTAQAPAGKTIVIRMFDGRTARPLAPSNFLVRIDHQDEIRNETLHIGDDGIGEVIVPADATFISVQGTYEDSTQIYINCDAGMEKNTGTLHWYPVANILSGGVIAPNECYKGKYERNPRINTKPGEFDFFVRKINLRDELD